MSSEMQSSDTTRTVSLWNIRYCLTELCWGQGLETFWAEGATVWYVWGSFQSRNCISEDMHLMDVLENANFVLRNAIHIASVYWKPAPDPSGRAWWQVGLRGRSRVPCASAAPAPANSEDKMSSEMHF